MVIGALYKVYTDMWPHMIIMHAGIPGGKGFRV